MNGKHEAFMKLCAALREQMEKLHEQSERLLVIAKEKQGMLVAHSDYGMIQDVTLREEKQADVISRLEAERMQIAAEIAALHNISPEDMTVSAIVKLAGIPMGPALENEARRLHAALVRLRECNDMNRQLIEMKLNYNAFMMDAFRREQGGPTNLYGANGQEDAYEGDIHRLLDSEV